MGANYSLMLTVDVHTDMIIEKQRQVMHGHLNETGK